MGKREREGNIGQGLFSPGAAPSHAYLRDSERRVGRYAYACDINMCVCVRHTHAHAYTHTSASRVHCYIVASRAFPMYIHVCVCEGACVRVSPIAQMCELPVWARQSLRLLPSHTHGRWTIDYYHRRAVSDSYRERRLSLLAQFEASRGVRVSRVCGSGHPVTRSRYERYNSDFRMPAASVSCEHATKKKSTPLAGNWTSTGWRERQWLYILMDGRRFLLKIEMVLC